ncbi:glycosyltransferase family 4 protein [Mannheimia sp. E30BD]|uniref:glycosyltransferase family 4 protein n=1 Tax=Mannheimia sp. E30BD TaxID=3278708 RepID=UPI00359DEBCF
MQSRKKIVLVATVASSIYGFRQPLIAELQKRGYHIYAFVSEYMQTELDKIWAMGVTVIPYQLNRGGLNPIADVWATYKLANQIRRIQPDLVFSYFSKPVIFGTLAAKMARVPKIFAMLEGLGYTFTEQPEGFSRKAKIIRKIQVILYRLSLPLADKVIFLNPDDPRDLLEKHQIKVKKVEVLGGIGLNLSDYPYQPVLQTENIRFLFIGRLLKEKGIHEFIAAAKIVKARYPNTIFTVLGAIDKMNLGALSQTELDSCIQTSLIEYPGQVSNVSEWIVNSQVFVLPSYREGVPRSTQEAMAVGRAVITTDVPGCRETVVNGLNGFLIPVWDSQVLAEKMIYFIENPEQITLMGNESYRIAQKKFDVDKINQRLISFLEL